MHERRSRCGRQWLRGGDTPPLPRLFAGVLWPCRCRVYGRPLALRARGPARPRGLSACRCRKLPQCLGARVHWPACAYLLRRVQRRGISPAEAPQAGDGPHRAAADGALGVCMVPRLLRSCAAVTRTSPPPCPGIATLAGAQGRAAMSCPAPAAASCFQRSRSVLCRSPPGPAAAPRPGMASPLPRGGGPMPPLRF